MIDTSPFKDIYPFESHTIPLGDLKYHYLDEGQGDILLMLHGNPTWSFYYRNLVLGLKDRYRCVVPDHIGCGLSDKPQNYDYTLSTHIDNLKALVDRLSLDNMTLMMHDWGGAIGMGLAVRVPEKIKRLIIFNTSAFLSDWIPFSVNICRNPIFGTLAIRCFNAFAVMAASWACRRKERMSGKVRDGYLAPYDSYANRIGNLRFVQDIPMTPDVPSYPVVKSIEEKLENFRNRPVLILWGKKDFCFNDHFLNRWKKFFPEAEVHEMEDAGHYVVEDAYEDIIPWIRDFLKLNPVSGLW
ncbi:MAG: alpha/beta fold hydrolase [Nitrospinota bacterium]|nr:alpha/beta fold hydrolase [Nitrospinota bacterium]